MEFMHKDDRFAITQEITGFSAFDSLMAGLNENCLGVGGLTVQLDSPYPSSGELTPYTFSTEVLQRRWARERTYVSCDFHTFLLEGHGRSVSEFVSQQDFERAGTIATASEVPFDGLGDIAKSLFFAGRDLDPRGFFAQVNVVAPAYSRIDSIEESSGRNFSVGVSGPPHSSFAEFRLNAITRSTWGPPVRQSFRFTEADVTRQVGYLRMLKGLQFADGQSVELFLLYRNEPIDRLSLFLPVRDTPNPRFIAHLVYDNDGTKLRELLFPKAGRPVRDTYETGVAWLLYLCGFQVVSHGLSFAKLIRSVLQKGSCRRVYGS